jgi:ABC-type phosphate transport system permease subunit
MYSQRSINPAIFSVIGMTNAKVVMAVLASMFIKSVNEVSRAYSAFALFIEEFQAKNAERMTLISSLWTKGQKRRAVAIVPAVVGAFVVIMVIITVFLAWGYFVGVYNTSGGLNQSLTNSSPQVAQQLNSFFTQINSLFGLLILVPLLAILGLVIVILIGWGGGGRE